MRNKQASKITETFDCKCCGQKARWCDEGPDACGSTGGCADIHCDNCGMHYSDESEEARVSETVEETKLQMKRKYSTSEEHR